MLWFRGGFIHAGEQTHIAGQQPGREEAHELTNVAQIPDPVDRDQTRCAGLPCGGSSTGGDLNDAAARSVRVILTIIYWVDETQTFLHGKLNKKIDLSFKNRKKQFQTSNSI